MKHKETLLLIIFFLALSIGHGTEEDKILLMKIGNKNLKNKTMEISAGKIYSAQTGRPISISGIIDEMMQGQFIYVGESHDNLLMHDIQLRIIKALFEENRELIIGLEMFPLEEQDFLNKWSLAILSADEFIRESRWYVHWNFNFGFYQKIFDFAKQNKIPLYALNVPRSLINKIRMRGWEALEEEEKKMIPQPDLSHREHRELIRTILESSPIPHKMEGKGLEIAFEGLYRAQSAWDEVMAYNALQVIKREKKRMVVLAGSGHLLYNLGINRRAFERNPFPFRTLICVEIPNGQISVKVSRSLADFIWGIEEQERAAYPSVGLRLKTLDGMDNLIIESQPIEGVARNVDFKKGDVILDVDGQPFTDINELRMYLAQFRWNDEVNFRLLRDGEEVRRVLKFVPFENKKKHGKRTEALSK